MRYLKLYESISGNSLDELRDFCNNYLVDLLDNGFEIEVKNEKRQEFREYNTRTIIYIRKKRGTEGIIFRWRYIKDNLFQF